MRLARFDDAVKLEFGCLRSGLGVSVRLSQVGQNTSNVLRNSVIPWAHSDQSHRTSSLRFGVTIKLFSARCGRVGRIGSLRVASRPIASHLPRLPPIASCLLASHRLSPAKSRAEETPRLASERSQGAPFTALCKHRTLIFFSFFNSKSQLSLTYFSLKASLSLSLTFYPLTSKILTQLNSSHKLQYKLNQNKLTRGLPVQLASSDFLETSRTLK